MIAINIISLGGDITIISADENSTIKDLKVKYIEERKDEGLDLEAYKLKFIEDTNILYDNTKLNELLGNESGKLNITYIQRPALLANCFREIKNLDSSSNNSTEMFDKLSAILTTNISEEEGISILASSDSEIVLAAFPQNELALQDASIELKANKEFMLAVVKKNGSALEFASPELKANKEFMLAAVQQDKWALEYASEGLKADYYFMLAAVQQSKFALAFASKELRNVRNIVLAAFKGSGLALEYASEGLRNDRNIVLAAVQQNGLALTFASEGLRNDRNIVLAAVQQNGLALQYASLELRNDSKILEKINSIPFEAFTRPLNEMERGQASASNSGTSNRQAYTTCKIISL